MEKELVRNINIHTRANIIYIKIITRSAQPSEEFLLAVRRYSSDGSETFLGVRGFLVRFDSDISTI